MDEQDFRNIGFEKELLGPHFSGWTKWLGYAGRSNSFCITGVNTDNGLPKPEGPFQFGFYDKDNDYLAGAMIDGPKAAQMLLILVNGISAHTNIQNVLKGAK